MNGNNGILGEKLLLVDVKNILTHLIGRTKPDVGELTIGEFERLAYVASVKHFKRKIGLPEQYQPGMPYPQQAYDVTAKIDNDLMPFKVSLDGKVNPFLIVNDGVAPYPKGFHYHIGMLVSGFKKPYLITPIDSAEMFRRESSYLEAPDLENAVCSYYDGYIKFLPKEIKAVRFDYLKFPRKLHYAVKEKDGVQVYDKQHSIELEWDNVNIVDIIYLIMFELGLGVEKADVLQVADKYVKEGV